MSDSLLIDYTGSLYYGGQTVGSTAHSAVGEYAVDFNHSLVGCAVVATPWSTINAEYMTVDYLGAGNVGGLVHVHVKDSTGAAKDGAFTLQTSC